MPDTKDTAKDTIKAIADKKTFVIVTLETPITRGETEISELTLRRPQSGELRGLSLAQLGQMNVDEVLKLLPRITSPAIIAEEAARIDPADLMEIAGEVGDFLLTRRKLREFQTA